MKLSAIIQEAEYRQKLVGVTESAKQFDALAASQKRAAAAGDILAKQTDISEKSITRIGSKLEAYQRRFDPLHKALADVERGERLMAAARVRGLPITDQMTRALENARDKLGKVSDAANDNSDKLGLNRMQMMESVHVLKSFADSVMAGQSPLRALAVEGGRIAQIFASGNNGVTGTLAAFGQKALWLVNPISGIAAGLGATTLAAIKTTSALQEIGKQAEQVGIKTSAIMGARTVGAGAGLDTKASDAALMSGAQAFEQFKRNSGGVLDFIEKFDKGFLTVADRARNAEEFIKLVGQEAQRLGGEKGLDLAERLLGPDQGRALLSNIGQFVDVLNGAPKPIDLAAQKAAEMEKQLAQAAEIADQKLLTAFVALDNPIESLKLEWYGVIGAMGDAIAKSETLQKVMQGFLHPFDTIANLPKTLGNMAAGDPAFKGRLVPVNDPFDTAKANFFAAGPQLNGTAATTAGSSRQSYAAAMAKTPRAQTGMSDAQRELENYEKIKKSLEDEIRLTQALGDAHQKVADQIEKEKTLSQLGKGATQSQRDTIAADVDKLQAAKRAADDYKAQQDMIKSAIDEAKSAAVDFGTSLVDAMRKGESGGKALMGVLQSLESKLLNKAMDSAISGIFDSVTKKDSGGGIFGALGSILSSLIPGATPHANGGVFGPGGSIPLHTYANGGVANSPQMAIFGEGRRPEAFVPLPDGRNIPVKMKGQQQGGAKITINNLHGGADVQAHETSTGEILITVQRMIDANNRKVPGIVANSQRRAM